MKALQKVCSVCLLTTIVIFGVSAQQTTPDKEKRPGAKVEKNKNEDKQQDNKNRGNDNKDRNKDNRDKDNKKPPGMK